MDKCREQLAAGLQLLNLPADAEKVERLLAFIALIEKWNKAYNLTAIRKRPDMVSLHLLDSLAIMPFLHGTRIIDIGTGAGLPGIPLAVYAPERQFVLLDSNQKKTRFVQQAVLELKLPNVRVVHSRAEDYRPEQLFDTVLARAFAALPEIVQVTRHLLAQRGILLAMKGRPPDEELAQIAAGYSLHTLHVPGIDAERCLVQVGPI
jgi:16S rRNA (guanine527-N7)-methyltransferase